MNKILLWALCLIMLSSGPVMAQNQAIPAAPNGGGNLQSMFGSGRQVLMRNVFFYFVWG